MPLRRKGLKRINVEKRIIKEEASERQKNGINVAFKVLKLKLEEICTGEKQKEINY